MPIVVALDRDVAAVEVKGAAALDGIAVIAFRSVAAVAPGRDTAAVDVDGAGRDANGARSHNTAAVDVDGACGPDAAVIVCVIRYADAATAHGEVSGPDSVIKISGNGYHAAAYGKVTCDVHESLLTTTKRSCACSLAVKGQIAAAPEAVIRTVRASSRLKFAAVGNNEVDVAVEVGLVVRTIIQKDVFVDDVPCGLAVGAEALHVCGHHRCGDVVSRAVLVDVISLDGFCPRRSAGQDERERHGRPHKVVFD